MTKHLLLLIITLFYLDPCGLKGEIINIDSILIEIQEKEKTVVLIEDCNILIELILSNNTKNQHRSLKKLINITRGFAENIDDTEGLAKASYSLGKYHISSGKGYSAAIPYLLESLSLYESLQDSSGISSCYMQLGLISYMTDYYEDAIKNFNLSLNHSSNTTSSYLMAISYSELDYFEEAKIHFKFAITDFKKKNNHLGLNECYMYLGKLFEKEGSLDSAFLYLNKAIDWSISTNNTEQLTRPYALISGLYLKIDSIEKAIYYAYYSYEASKNGTDKISAILSVETLSKAYALKKDYNKAHQYLKTQYTLKNESIKGNTKQKIAEMQSLFDFNKKINDEKMSHQVELWRKNRVNNIYLASGIIILLLAGGLWSRLHYIRLSKARLQKAKNTSEKLLLNILPEEIAQELKEKGRAEARYFENAAILFSDFKDFTSISAQLNPKDLVTEIHTCFEAFDRIMFKYKVEKIKTIGDAYMAAGGLPKPSPNALKHVVLAAIDMQKFIIKRKKKLDKQNRNAFQMRVGIHIGPVVAGIVGVNKFQYDIWGDTVNTASRMESSGRIDKVNISEAAYSIIKNEPEFNFENRGKINAKGKGEMTMWFVWD